MTYEDFIKFVQSKCMHETIYEDSEGRLILVIDMLDAYGMVNKASQPTGVVASKLNPPQRTWVGLTDDEQQQAYEQWQNDGWGVFYNAIEAKLRSKNNV